MKTQFICWDAGSGNCDIAKYNHNVEWHNDSDVFRGTYAECLEEKRLKEVEAYRFNHCLPHLSND